MVKIEWHEGLSVGDELIDDQHKMIAKKTASFEFEYHGKKMILDGSKIAYRPEDRIKKVR